VDIADGAVVLRGAALDASERQRAENAVRQASGLGRIRNELTLTSSTYSDADIARALTAYVERATHLPVDMIRVDYTGGTATLVGAVSSLVQAQAIEDLVRWHDRVDDVVNLLNITPAPEVMPAPPR
jgi:osmotically-inducible protein OsmY